MSEHGAIASYRGYRIQGLYILNRILEPGLNANSIFIPEGIEDLAIQESNTLREIVQVKSYNGLSLSDLEPAKEGSFFHRAINYIKQDPCPKIRIVNVGPIGKELENAWRGDKNASSSITNKLLQYGFTQDQVQEIFEHIEIISEDENNLTSIAFNQLQSILTGTDPENAFDLLRQWLADCSEARTPISINDLIIKINAVGQFLADRAHYHKEWFTNIEPIEDYLIKGDQKAILQGEFFAGVSVRYEHILANLDFHRSEKIDAVHKGFSKSNIVIIHGASGQGKSTLAYRYLHDYYSDYSRFQIQLIENRQHVHSTATALSGHANALKIPLVVYFDVSPRDQDWFELVDRLTNQPFIRVLVTIREEDFRRTNIPSHIDFEDVNLEFNEEEAYQIYERARDSGFELEHLTFDDTWDAFGEEGPLLEFVYLLTQTITLRQRLEEQVDRLKNEVRNKELAPDELLLLRLVAIVTAFEGRLYIPSLIDSLDIPEPTLTLHNYEKEYLIRMSPDNVFIEALHPIRSEIIVDLLSDRAIYPWINLLEMGLSHTLEEDWETVILQALIKQTDLEENILSAARNLSPSSWNGYAGLIRCFLWVGVKKYIDKNHHLVNEAQELMGPAWFFILDLNFAGEDAGSIEGWWNNLDNLISDDARVRIEEIRGNQTPKNEVFQIVEGWLMEQDNQPKPPESSQDWGNVAETLYWTSRFGCSDKFFEVISDELISYSFETLSLGDFSELAFAFYKCKPDWLLKWLEENDEKIKIRLFEEYRIILLDHQDQTITIHFLSYPEEHIETKEYVTEEKNSIHDATMERIQVLRYLFPEFEKYGSQGYGHQVPGLGDNHDDSVKIGIPKYLLPPKWPIRVNGIATGLLRSPGNVG
jgi:hypothetical protein